jgi:cytochrome c oxidase subunit 2
MPILASITPWIPVFQPESPDAAALRDLFLIVLALSALIFAGVVVLIAVAAVRFRDRGEGPPKPAFGSPKVEIAWTVGAAFVTFWLAALAVKLVLTLNAVPHHEVAAGPADLVVVGHQWWWEARYPGSGAVAANEIHIPVGQRLRVRVESADVVHSFWVPQLARKIDMIPGRQNFVWLEAGRPGIYEGACSEFCGAQHAWMRLTIVAQEPAAFERWVQSQLQPAAEPATAAARRGRELFFSQTCPGCHAIGGTPARATLGPDLTHLASRSELAGGVVPNDRSHLTRWLSSPQIIKPGCKMPDFNLTRSELDYLVTYLETMR